MKKVFLLLVLFSLFFCFNTYAEDSLSENGISEVFSEPPGISETKVTFEPDPNDFDRDGLSKADEEKYGTDPYDPDIDNDGFTDLWEITNGTDPNNRNNTNYFAVIYFETKK